MFVCTIAEDAGVIIPAWMFDAALCSRMTLGTRRASIVALRELRSIVDEIRSAFPTGSSGTVASEESDDKIKIPRAKTSASCPPDGARISDEGATRCATADGGRRAAQSSPSSSGARSQRERGGR